MDKIRELRFNHHQLKLIWRDDSDLSVIDEFFIDKMYRSVETIISNIKNPILDIGAHIGIFSIYSKIINPQSEIIAIEPEPKNYELLKMNLKQNNIKNVIPVQAALIAGNNLNTKLYLSENTHNHSTVPLSTDCIQVPATNLEKLIKKYKLKTIGLLKMDIEGAEFEIVLNIENGTWDKMRYLIVEYHESENNKRGDMEDIIRQHGFSVEHFPNKFDKRFGLLVCRNKKTA